ncbi:MAG: PQQ-dependent sugar dehydrogenase [Acidimicrobiia bacterium]|nr:PQQ-dependent sugar dehydrogenase [Acidimicrobiia bacterium]
MTPRRLLAVVLAGLLTAAGCAGDDEASAPPAPVTGDRSEAVGAADSPALELVADVDLSVAVAADPVSGRLLVATKDGRLVAVDADEPTAAEELIDITDRVSDNFEQGLLGVAVHPTGSHVYLSYTDLDGHSHIIEFAMADGRPDPATERLVMYVEQPGENHNGGTLRFDDDGLLWISLGDGHARTGLGPGTSERAQDLTFLHGSILRIDPRADLTDTEIGYGIPDDNPFVGVEGARPEIWAYGLRNPWSFTIDPATGDLWIADVGHDDWDEINYAPASEGAGRGANYGWPTYEGLEPWDGPPLDDHVPPSEVFSHDDGYCALVGGPTYRGEAIESLVGWTLMGDLCHPELFAVRPDGQGGLEVRPLGIELDGVVGFGLDVDGEVLVVTGREGIHALVPA